MASTDPNPDAESPTTGAPSSPGTPTAPRSARVWPWALVAGLAAGVVAGVGGEAGYGRFETRFVEPANWDKVSAFDKPDIMSTALRKQTPGVEAKNTAIAYGLLGASLGVALGLAGGVPRRSARSTTLAVVVGGIAGAAAGAGMSAALVPVFYRSLDPESGMLLGLLIHAGIWVPIGAAAGLALGLGLGGRRSMILALFGGLAGAALGTMLFEVISALLFPDVRMDSPIPDGRSSRLVAVFCVSISTALGAALGVGQRDRKPDPIPELPDSPTRP